MDSGTSFITQKTRIGNSLIRVLIILAVTAKRYIVSLLT